jgi:hypothetical protein
MQQETPLSNFMRYIFPTCGCHQAKDLEDMHVKSFETMIPWSDEIIYSGYSFLLLILLADPE